MRLPPERADWAALATLHARAFSGVETPWSAAALESFARSPSAALFVDRAARPSGFVLTRLAADEAELVTIAVDPGARRQGLGAALLEAARAEGRARGAAIMFLEVAQTNAAARALYMRAGFEEAGRRPGYYLRPGFAPVDAIILRVALSA